ncbi:MAG: hypothetical protein ACO31I_05180, partial [Prochlorotrichaceae cyanobacterium]
PPPPPQFIEIPSTNDRQDSRAAVVLSGSDAPRLMVTPVSTRGWPLLLLRWSTARSFQLSGRSPGEGQPLGQNFCLNSQNTYQNI